MGLHQNAIQDFIQIQALIQRNGGFYQRGEIRIAFLKLARALADAALQFSIHLFDALFRLFSFGDIAQHTFRGYSLSICIEDNVRRNGSEYCVSILLLQERFKIVDRAMFHASAHPERHIDPERQKTPSRCVQSAPPAGSLPAFRRRG